MSERPSGRRPGIKKLGGVYQGSVEAVVALLLAMGIGYWADERYETAPWLLLLGVVIGFGAFVLRIWRLRALVEAQSAEAGRQAKR